MKRWASEFMFAAGSLALLLSMAVNFTSVVGRRLGANPLGATEIVQLCSVAAISAALIVATIHGAHASVHILTERLPKPVADGLARLSDLLGALLFLILAAGSAWMLADTWPLGERTDVIGLPLGPARIVWIAALTATALILLVRAVARRLASESDHGQ